MKNNSKEIIGAMALIALATFLVNPFDFWMPTMMHLAVIAGMLTFFSFFASYVLREHAQDEREALHRMLAGRVAFLTGAGVCIVGIITESFLHSIDPWLVITLTAMLLAKLASRWYSDRRL